MNKPLNITDKDWELLKEKYVNLDKIVELINLNYPVQYLIGNVDFYGYKIKVNKNVLIPRFETEGLVEQTIKLIHKYDLDKANVLDIGTGSGCIPIVLKSEIKTLRITSIDISNKALRVAKNNARENKVDITFINKSVFKYKPINRYSVLISNPPYVDKEEKVDPQTKYEPQFAIFANDNGLEFYKHIINNYDKYMTNKFIMAFEIGYKQGDTLKEIAMNKYPNAKVEIKKDLAGLDRYLFIIQDSIEE